VGCKARRRARDSVTGDLGPWRPLSLDQARSLFAPATFVWWVVGGQALDLYVGRQTRAHADLDLAMCRSDAWRLRPLLARWDLQLAHDGVLTGWTGDDVAPPVASIWCRTGRTEPWCLQIMVDEGTSLEWACRRHPDLVIPRSQAVRRTADGLRYLAPHIQLLMKATDTRPKDDADFRTVYPRLAADNASWLVARLRQYFPTHHWLTQVGAWCPDADEGGR
jgi:hypothetical protein